MEGLVLLKISDLEEVFTQLKELRGEIKELKEQEENLTAFSIEQVAKKLNLHYTSVRRLILKKKLFAKYLEGTRGKCVIPMWAVKSYLTENNNNSL